MRASAAYRWITVAPGQHRFLRMVCESLGLPDLRVWIDSRVSGEAFARTDCEGLVTATGQCDGRTVAIAWSDFRVNAASFGEANSRRFAAFLQELDRSGSGPVPLIYLVNSAGISLMEGRTVFSDAFALWPALLQYAERHPVLTCADGKCLGLAPVLFGLGHYRVAVAGHTQLNLTGPDVIRMFFGEGVDFERAAAAESFHDGTDLVHELVPSVEAACARFREILSPTSAPYHPAALGTRTEAILSAFLDTGPRELVPGWCDRVRLFLGTRRGTPIGIFVNPPERSNNLITVRTLEKYAAGLDLFRALGMPIVSFLDSPGFDPRFDQSAANNFRRMLWVGEKIIHYPHGAMGVVTGRCFGGSATLVFPKVFGGSRMLALRGSRIGIMHESIVTRVLSGCPRLREQWDTVAARQTPGFEDLLEEGSVDAVVDLPALAAEIDRFLAGRAAPATARRTARPALVLSARRAPMPATFLQRRTV
jgi:acetyl-CoA carboxylase carboxyltransferase component